MYWVQSPMSAVYLPTSLLSDMYMNVSEHQNDHLVVNSHHNDGLMLSCACLFSMQITTTLEQVKDFMSGTLLGVQEDQLCVERNLWDMVHESLAFLKEKDLITVSQCAQGETLEITKLGKATYKSESSV